MSNPQAIGQNDIKIRIKEAEACYSMGMIADALGVYERILKGPPISDDHIQGTIKQKISQLKKEVADQEKNDRRGVTAEDISLFKKTLSAHEDVPTLLDGARALKELGLLEEAVAEYEKLMEFDFSKSDYSKFDYSPAKIIQDFLDCLLETKPPQEVVKTAYKAIYKHSLKDPEVAELKFWLGSEMEKKAQKDIASEICKKVDEIDQKTNKSSDKVN